MLALLLIACDPQHATIENGHWYSWLAKSSSKVFIDESLPSLDIEALVENGVPEGYDLSLIECYRGSSDPNYLPEVDGIPHITGDACGLEEDTEGDNAGETINSITFESHKFLQNDSFYAMHGEIKPWRTEAIINGEGDLQLTVHTMLPDNEDFRFNFVIKPNFRPVHCITNDFGEPVVEFVDGSDWVTQWSADEDGHQIYYLNAGAYQINPSEGTDYWFLTTDWLSGFGAAKFSAEEFNSVPGHYGNYDENGGGDNFMMVEDRSAPNYSLYNIGITDLEEKANTWATELSVAGLATTDGTAHYTQKIESNFWRPIDNANAGLDGWAEVHSSWVRLTDSSEFYAGGVVEGDFQILYNAEESNSHLLVSGKFRIDDLQEDPWAYPMLENDKREEYGTPFCGGAVLGQ